MDEQPIEKRDTRAEAIGSVVRFAFTYGVVVGLWGLALNKDFVLFGVVGAILGSILSLIFAVPVISTRKTYEDMDDAVSGTNAIWGAAAIYVGISGVIVWIVRIIFW